MPESIRSELTPEEELLVLAVSDLYQAAAAAHLLVQQIDPHARRALETAISVCYARPWSEMNRSGTLGKKWLPAAGADRDLHYRLIELRKKTYAHTDPVGGRKGVAHYMGDEIIGLGEQWTQLPRADRPAIEDLCARQANRFSQAVADGVRLRAGST